MRKEIEGRPALALLIALIVGLTAPQHPANLLFLILIPIFYAGLSVRWLSGLCFLGGVLIAPQPGVMIQEKRPIKSEGIVASSPRIYPDVLSFELLVDDVRLAAYVQGRPFLVKGDHIKFVGQLKPLSEGSEKYLTAKGLQARMTIRDFQITERGPLLYQWAENWKRSFVNFADRSLPPKQASIVQAVCFNVDTALDQQTRDDLERSGTIHIVSASGLHVLILAMATVFALSKVPIPRWGQLIAAFLVLGFYALATGMNPPVVRSVLMVMVAFAAYVCSREPDTLSSLSLAAMLYLVWKPVGAYDIGFQLSFLTVASFALFLPASRASFLSPIQRGLAEMKSVALVSLVATVASAPVVAYHFGQVSAVAVVANLLISVVVAPMMVLAVVAHGVSLLVPPTAFWIMDFPVQGCATWVISVVDWISKPSWAVVHAPSYPAYWTIPMYGIILYAWRPIARQP